jgi:hypothetical protein
MRIILNNVFVKFLLNRYEVRVLRFLYSKVKITVVELVDLIIYAFEALSLMAFLAWEKVIKDLH